MSNLSKELQAYCNKSHISYKKAKNGFFSFKREEKEVLVNLLTKEVKFTDAEPGEFTNALKFIQYEFPAIKVLPKVYEEEATVCPAGHHMILRTNRKDNSKFWGCSRWPDCKHKKPYYD